jgi:DNA-directed RNA polymerase subunit RPC12/RpoP
MSETIRCPYCQGGRGQIDGGRLSYVCPDCDGTGKLNLSDEEDECPLDDSEGSEDTAHGDSDDTPSSSPSSSPGLSSLPPYPGHSTGTC